MKLLYCWLICLFSPVFAQIPIDLEKYCLYVAGVDPQAHAFLLSNDLICNIAEKNLNVDSLPEIGDEVRLVPRLRNAERRHGIFEEGEFEVVSLKNAKNVARIWVTPGSEKNCLTCVSSGLVSKQPAGWFTPAIYSEVVALSDGSKWILETKGLKGFNRGDRIIVTKVDQNRWAFINIDRSIFSESIDKTKKIWTRYVYCYVQPYFSEGE